MKHTLLMITALMLVVGCSKEPEKEPINYETTLIERDGVHYTKDTNKPYSGPVFSLDKNGQNDEEGILKDGKKDGKWTFWFSGYITIDAYIGNDASDASDVGPHYFKQYEVTYKDGKRYGKWTRWHRNGQKEAEGILKDGKKDGKWTYWYENGQKSGEITYKDGAVISSKCWDEDGNEIDCDELE